MADLLEELNKEDIAQFLTDFSEIIRVAEGIDREYREPHSVLNDQFPEFESLVQLFIKKYSGIILKINKTLEHIRLRTFLKETSLSELLKNSSRISGLRGLGTEHFNEVPVSDGSSVIKFSERIKDSLYLSYTGINNEEYTLLLRQNKKTRKSEVIYQVGTVINKNHPEFKIITYYALKAGYKKSIDFYSKSALFSFQDVLTEDEKNKALSRFNPNFLE